MSDIERSHGKPRVTRKRLRDVPTAETVEERRREDHDAGGRFTVGNRAAVASGARRAISRHERAALASQLESAAGGQLGGVDRAALLRDVMRLYASARRTLASREPIVLSSALTWARESALAGFLTAQAVELGITTEPGLQLLDAAQKCEARAERASLHAATMAERLAPKRAPADPHRAVFEAFASPPTPDYGTPPTEGTP